MKRKDIIILEDFFGRDLALDYFAENAIIHIYVKITERLFLCKAFRLLVSTIFISISYYLLLFRSILELADAART